VVGDALRSTTGVAGRFFAALGAAKINVLAISQGSSERNISAVVLEEESSRALRAVHAEFHLSQPVVSLVVVCNDGIYTDNGNSEKIDMHSEMTEVDEISVSQAFLHRLSKITGDVVYQVVKSTGDEQLVDTMSEWFSVKKYDNATVVDCRRHPSTSTSMQVQQWLNAGLRVVSLNPRVASELATSSKLSTRAALYNILPVESLLRDLHKSGAIVVRIEATLAASLVENEVVGQMMALYRAASCCGVSGGGDSSCVKTWMEKDSKGGAALQWWGHVNVLKKTIRYGKKQEDEKKLKTIDRSIGVSIFMQSSIETPIVLTCPVNSSASLALALIQGVIALSPKGMQSLVRGSPILSGKTSKNRGKKNSNELEVLSL